MIDTVTGWKLNNHLQCVLDSALLPGGAAAAAAQPTGQLSTAEPSCPQVPSAEVGGRQGNAGTFLLGLSCTVKLQ